MENKVNILSTYPLTRELIEKVRNESTGHTGGQTPELCFTSIPFISTVSNPDSETRSKIKILGNRRLTAIFTSARAVSAVFSLFTTAPDWSIYCLAGKTKEAILRYLPAENIRKTAAYGKTLAEEIVAEVNNFPPEEPVYFFCGSIRMPTLPDILKTHQIPLEEITVYHTRLSPEKVDAHFDGILFFSPSAVESFFSVNNIQDATTLFSVGQTTSAAIEQYTGNKVITAPEPSAELVLRSVWDYYGASSLH